MGSRLPAFSRTVKYGQKLNLPSRTSSRDGFSLRRRLDLAQRLGEVGGVAGMADRDHGLDGVVVGDRERGAGAVVVEAHHAVDDEPHGAALQRQVLERGAGVEAVHGVRLAVPGEDLVREHDDQHAGPVAPGAVALGEEIEERRPVRALAVRIEKAPLLLVVARRRPARRLEEGREIGRR